MENLRPEHSLLLEDESQIDLISYSLERNFAITSPNLPVERMSNFPRKHSQTDSSWFSTNSSFKSNCSSTMSETSTGYGSFRDSDKHSPSFFAEDERFSQSSADFDYYSGSSSASSTTSGRNFDENCIDALYRNAEFYDLETVDLNPKSSSEPDNFELDSLDEVKPSPDLARAGIAEMAQCVLSMISELKTGPKPEKLSPPSVPLGGGLESIPETDDKETEHIYQEIPDDSTSIDLTGIKPPPLPPRNYHCSMITVSSCPNCNSAFVPKEKFVRRSLPPTRRFQAKSSGREFVEIAQSDELSSHLRLNQSRAISLNSLAVNKPVRDGKSRCNSVSAACFGEKTNSSRRSSLEHLSPSLSSERLHSSENKRKGHILSRTTQV